MQTFSIEPATANDCYECAQILVEHLKELGIDASAKALARVSEDVARDSARGFILVAREERPSCRRCLCCHDSEYGTLRSCRVA